MSKPSTQDTERFYFEEFRKAYPLPDGQIVHGDKPDIIRLCFTLCGARVMLHVR
jgi:hypothetical protein